MKKIIVILLGIVFLASCVTMQPYDSDEVKMSMQTIMGTARGIGGALEAGDLSEVPDNFMTLKKEFYKLSKMEPPRGSGEEWTMIYKEMMSLSKEGKKAAEMGDAEKVGAILGELFALQQKGHTSFKD